MGIKRNLKQKLSSFNGLLAHHSENSRSVMTLFGIFGLVNYPVFYVFWKYYSDSGYDDIYPRSIAIILCFLLAFNKFWPTGMRPALPLYWYLTVMYCLPFYGTYAFLMNHASYSWTLNIILGLFWLVIVLDWVSFAIILPIGAALGLLFYRLTAGAFEVNEPNVITTLINVLWVIITTSLFVRRKEIFNQEKLETMKLLASAIAHELRTPLRAISSGATGLKKYLPSLLESYKVAKDAQLVVPTIDSIHMSKLTNIPLNIELEARSSFFFIDMLLMKLSQASNGVATAEIYSVQDCINEAITRYPLRTTEKQTIQWDPKNDFQFRGDKALLVHVIFNLIRNALYYIQVAKKGEIEIWVESSNKESYVHFKDTSAGIPAQTLPHIFDSFYTTTKHGTGIGLAFCKSVMQSMNGGIECISEEDSYTEFVLKFPKVG